MLHRRELIAAAGGAIAAAAGGAGTALAAPSPYGRFIGGVAASWDLDGRHMRLLQPFGYVGPGGDEWPVPKGATVDGASIPRPVWALIGGPFEGRYRNASVVHDWYCDVRTRPWREVHRMFFNGMLAAGVSESQARLMYYAVYAGGPRWDDQAIENNKLAVERKVAQLAQDPAPAVLQTCGAGGCNLIYSSPGQRTAMASAAGASWLGALFRPLLPHPAVAPPPPPPTRYETLALEGGAEPPPVTDPAQLVALARRLAASSANLAEGEQVIEQSRAVR